jgi:hypothetical protein
MEACKPSTVLDICFEIAALRNRNDISAYVIPNDGIEALQVCRIENSCINR